MVENKFRFTPARLEKLKPGAKTAMYYDVGAPLALWVTPAGVKTFCVYRRVNGRPCRVRIGRVGDVALGDARKAATKLLGEVAGGGDPAAERTAKRKQATFAMLWAYWFDHHAKTKKKTWKEDKRLWDNFLSDRWGSRQLGAIKKADVVRLHNEVGEKNGPYAANRLLALIHAMYGKADDLGYTGPNPAHRVTRFAEQKRDRFLGADELPRFFSALEEEEQPWRDIFALLVLTAARKGNLLAMRWADIDFSRQIWRIPDTKGGKPVVVPLVLPALNILRLRQQDTGHCEYVFPAFNGRGHICDPRTAWKRILQRAELDDVRPHDLRRSLASWMTIGGATLPIVGRMLGHQDGSPATAVYARLNVDPVRQAAELAAMAMLAHTKQPTLILEGTSDAATKKT